MLTSPFFTAAAKSAPRAKTLPLPVLLTDFEIWSARRDASSTRADVDGNGAVGANRPTVTPSACARVDAQHRSVSASARDFMAPPPCRKYALWIRSSR